MFSQKDKAVKSELNRLPRPKKNPIRLVSRIETFFLFLGRRGDPSITAEVFADKPDMPILFIWMLDDPFNQTHLFFPRPLVRDSIIIDRYRMIFL